MMMMKMVHWKFIFETCIIKILYVSTFKKIEDVTLAYIVQFLEEDDDYIDAQEANVNEGLLELLGISAPYFWEFPI